MLKALSSGTKFAKCDDWIWADWELSQVIPMKAELGDWLVHAYLRQHSD